MQDCVVLYGRAKRRTAKAVLWHVWLDQPPETPSGLCGEQVWFPRAAVVEFRTRSGRTALDVPRRLVDERIAALAPRAANSFSRYERQDVA